MDLEELVSAAVLAMKEENESPEDTKIDGVYSLVSGSNSRQPSPSTQLREDLGLEHLAQKTIRPRTRDQLLLPFEGMNMHVSEDGTEIHIRRYDSPKDYVGAKAFLMGRWLFTYVMIPSLVFSWIILGALVFKSINEPYDKNLCITGIMKLLDVESHMKNNVVLFLAETSTIWRRTDRAEAAAEVPDSEVAGFLPLPALEPGGPMELRRLINASHLEFEQILGMMTKQMNRRHILSKCDEEFWTFLEAMLLTFTLCTTIGYGYITPNSPWGLGTLLWYSTVGVPLTILMMNNLGDAMKKVLVRIYAAAKGKCDKWKRKREKRRMWAKKMKERQENDNQSTAQNDENEEESMETGHDVLKYFFQVDRLKVKSHDDSNLLRLPLNAVDARNFEHNAIDCTRMKPRESLAMLQIILEEQEFAYLQSAWSDIRLSRISSKQKNVPLWLSSTLLLVFVVTCAFVWMILTEWEFLQCLYFAFATFTTIGFGDINPVNSKEAEDDTQRDKILMEVIQVVMIAFGILMLSLCVSLMYSELRSIVFSLKIKCFPKKIGDDADEDDDTKTETDWESADDGTHGEAKGGGGGKSRTVVSNLSKASRVKRVSKRRASAKSSRPSIV